MPLYLYRCKACGEEEEHLQKFSDPPMSKCETCGGKLEKVITPTAFHLKGGGWYKDLYASAKPGGDGGGSDAAGSDGGSGKGSKGSKGSAGGSSSGDKKKSGDKGGGSGGSGDKAGKKSSKKAASK